MSVWYLKYQQKPNKYSGDIMMERAQLKRAARAQIKGSIGVLFLCLIVMSLICGTVLGVLFVPVINLGFCLMYLGLANGVKPSVGDMFKRVGIFGRALWLMIITGFFTMLWSMLFYVPGFIKSISYSMGPYILAEHPEFTARQALNESKRIMNGHKMDYFVLTLSFIPWFLLGSITFGLAFIYVYPYMNVTFANFYNAIKNPQQ